MILDCKDFVVAFYTIFAETCMKGSHDQAECILSNYNYCASFQFYGDFKIVTQSVSTQMGLKGIFRF